MADVLLFHHALGATPGFLEFADRVRAAGDTMHAPDLYGGRIFAELDVCRTSAAEVAGARLFVHQGSGHLFAEPAPLTTTPERQPA